MSGSELVAWYCVGYVGVFVLGLVLLIIGMLGLGGDHDMDHDVSHDHDTAHDQDTHHSALLDFLGIGRCPVSIVLMTLCFLFTLFGMGTVLILRTIYMPGLIVGAIAYPVAAVLSFMFTGAVARVIGRLMPSNETYVESESHHIGSVGKAVYGFEDGQGFVQVADSSGTVHEIKATAEDAIVAGATVIVLDYNADARTFHVQLAPLELAKGV